MTTSPTAQSKQRLTVADGTHKEFKIAAIIAGKNLFEATEEAIREWTRKQNGPKTKRRDN